MLVPTTRDLDADVYAALRAGARASLLGEAAPDRLVAALHAVGDGGTLLVVAPGDSRPTWRQVRAADLYVAAQF